MPILHARAPPHATAALGALGGGCVPLMPFSGARFKRNMLGAQCIQNATKALSKVLRTRIRPRAGCSCVGTAIDPCG